MFYLKNLIVQYIIFHRIQKTLICMRKAIDKICKFKDINRNSLNLVITIQRQNWPTPSSSGISNFIVTVQSFRF
jgi:hypothetical protein